MGTPRRAILVGLAMLAACGQKSSEPAPASGSATPTPSGKAAISAPERPTLTGSGEPETPPETESAPPVITTGIAPTTPAPSPDRTANPAKDFERQTRDPSWAGPTETEIRKRVSKVGVKIDSAECRHDRCLIAVRGSEEQVADTFAKLETADGLQGFAQSIYLTAPVHQNGTLVVRAYATFDR